MKTILVTEDENSIRDFISFNLKNAGYNVLEAENGENAIKQYNENRNEIDISESLMNLITTFQDTVHDTAITYHRKLREKSVTKSELDDIKGIGKVKKQELLKKFGSLEKIKQASIEELCKVKGITKELAEKIKK